MSISSMHGEEQDTLMARRSLEISTINTKSLYYLTPIKSIYPQYMCWLRVLVLHSEARAAD